MGGLRDRLEKELAEQGPQAGKFKVTMPANPTERRFSVWIGERGYGAPALLVLSYAQPASP